ncbi:nuclear transport factor 2 family protein [Streptomyces sp. NPDC005805]|uniref:nuclear transport factor 2 family protein n=1 Tax=Streptomyces sp. NPDC005805 TaxID=3157068 RepID=UPI0033FA0E9A
MTGADARVALERYARTRHLATAVRGAAVDGPDRATVRWNALMTHIHHESTRWGHGQDADPEFVVAGTYEAELRRTAAGRRISRMTIEVEWTTGRPPVLA